MPFPNMHEHIQAALLGVRARGLCGRSNTFFLWLLSSSLPPTIVIFADAWKRTFCKFVPYNPLAFFLIYSLCFCRVRYCTFWRSRKKLSRARIFPFPCCYYWLSLHTVGSLSCIMWVPFLGSLVEWFPFWGGRYLLFRLFLTCSGKCFDEMMFPGVL